MRGSPFVGTNEKAAANLSYATASEYIPACAVFAGIPNLMAQGGRSQFNFGFVELATIAPTKHVPQPMRKNGSRNIWQISNTAG
jgi:hypothetical protein